MTKQPPGPARQPYLLTLPEAAARLHISRSRLYRLIDAGELKSIHLGARHYVTEPALTAYSTRQGGAGEGSAEA